MAWNYDQVSYPFDHGSLCRMNLGSRHQSNNVENIPRQGPSDMIILNTNGTMVEKRQGMCIGGKQQHVINHQTLMIIFFD